MIAIGTNVLMRSLAGDVAKAREGFVVEMDLDIARGANRYRGGGPDFCELMIHFAAERSGAEPWDTIDRKAARLDGVTLLSDREAS